MCEMCDPMGGKRTEEPFVKRLLEMAGWGRRE